MNPNSATIEDLVPRGYQTEIFEEARERNVICAMETGSGKVLASNMLRYKLHIEADSVTDNDCCASCQVDRFQARERREEGM
ncbi:hypothetical protein DL93DRAFT_2072470 [Clavulina sp. PMI_390]|nr:hypothetical protein DL93DRAFT_2072470 [Clavulina sp. PMI_390]